MEDKIITCPHCGLEMLYEYPHPQLTQWMCFGCGYGSTSHMVSGSDFVIESRKVLPELVKDLEFIDSDNQVWYPNSIKLEGKGMLFPNGANKNEWGWTVAPMTEILEEEKSRFPSGQKYKIDMQKMIHFDKESYAAAVNYLNSLS